MKKLLLTLLALSVVSCSSYAPKKKTFETMDGDSKPDWATLSKPVYEKDGKYFSVGYSEASGTANISMMTSIASNDARAKLAKMVENKMISVFQNISEGVEDDGSLVRRFASERSSVLMRGAIEENIYYEKVYISEKDDKGYARTQLYSLVSIPKERVASLIKESENKLKNQAIGPSTKDQADKQLNELIKDEETTAE